MTIPIQSSLIIPILVVRNTIILKKRERIELMSCGNAGEMCTAGRFVCVVDPLALKKATFLLRKKNSLSTDDESGDGVRFPTRAHLWKKQEKSMCRILARLWRAERT